MRKKGGQYLEQPFPLFDDPLGQGLVGRAPMGRQY